MKAEQIKKAILKLAVEGKLVKQDPNDEPASVLLDRIRKENGNKSVIFRKGDSFYEQVGQQEPVCIDEEIPYKIPISWEWVRLGEVGFYKKGPFGSRLKKSMFVKKASDTIKVYEQKNAIKKDVSLGEYYITAKYFEEEMQSFEVFPEDIIVSCSGTIGESYILPKNIEKGIINQALMIMRLYNGLDKKFFVIYFDYVIKEFSKQNSKGAAIKNIPPFKIFKRILLPIPPLEEQKRIVAKFEELIPEIEEYGINEEKLTKLNNTFGEELKKSVLQYAIEGKLVEQDSNDEPASILLDRIREEKEELIKEKKIKRNKNESVIFRKGDSFYEQIGKQEPVCIDEEIPYEIPSSWEWVRVGTISDYGNCKTIKAINIGEDEWVLDLEDIEKNTGKILRKKKYKEVKSKSKKHIFEKGQLLFSKLRPYLNKVVIVDDNGCCSNEIIPINFYDNIDNRYIQKYFMSNLFLTYCNKCTHGTNIPRLGNNDGQNALLPLPPLEEQKRIVDAIERTLYQVDVAWKNR